MSALRCPKNWAPLVTAITICIWDKESGKEKSSQLSKVTQWMAQLPGPRGCWVLTNPVQSPFHTKNKRKQYRKGKWIELQFGQTGKTANVSFPFLQKHYSLQKQKPGNIHMWLCCASQTQNSVLLGALLSQETAPQFASSAWGRQDRENTGDQEMGKEKNHGVAFSLKGACHSSTFFPPRQHVLPEKPRH